MKTASPELQARLAASDALQMADLYTVTLHDGTTIFRWTSADVDIVSGGNTFTSLGPLLKRGKIRETAGLEVDTLDVTIMHGSGLTILGLPFPLAAVNGTFDGASVKLERAFMATFGDTSAGTINRFEGNVAEVEPSSTQVLLKVKSELEKLNILLPRKVFMPQCSHAVYDAGCGLSRAAFTVTGTATGAPTTMTIPSAVSGAGDYYKLGVLTMTSGAAIGAKRAVKSFVSGTFGLAVPLPVAPAAGDTFTVYPGCDKTIYASVSGTGKRDDPYVTTPGTCVTKFNNAARFAGFPWVPRSEQAI